MEEAQKEQGLEQSLKTLEGIAKKGRKPRLTLELADIIAKLISTGNYATVVCGIVGIGTTTYYRWLEQGDKARSGLYRDFWVKIKRAEAIRELRWVKEIEGDPSWQSKAWLLERRYPERWAKKDNLNLTADVKGTIKHEGGIAEAIKNDPVAAELAFQLYERTRMGQDVPGGSGGTGEQEALETGSSPGDTQP